MFAINFQDKLMMTFVIFFGFFLLVFCVSGYTLYFHFYAKLSSYFLDNLYRLHSSFLIVTTIYGVRPLLRGIMHAFLGEYTVIQLFSIAGIDLVTIFLIVIVEFKRKVYISKCGLLCDLIYYISLMLFNLLLVCDLYAKGIRELVEVVEHVM